MRDSSSPVPIQVNPNTDQGYPIFIGNDLFTNHELIQKFIPGKQVCLIASENLPSDYAKTLQSTLKKMGSLELIDSVQVADRDENKSLEAANLLWGTLIERGHRRDTTLIALGGGVIGDLVGFVASTYLRGVAWINYPTTLLAQVDAAIGGKVAVNHRLGKNLIGSFHSPKAVCSDLLSLKTLPEREYVAGLAEVVKYGLALDHDLLNWLNARVDEILRHDPATLEKMVHWCSNIKADIVSRDFKETNLRMLLNFGHTLGHAIETGLDYELRHGEAISLGMCAAMEVSKDYGLSQEDVDESVQLLEKFKLPTKLETKISAKSLLDIMKRDKKFLSGQRLRFIVLKALGQAVCVESVSEPNLVQALQSIGIK